MITIFFTMQVPFIEIDAAWGQSPGSLPDIGVQRMLDDQSSRTFSRVDGILTESQNPVTGKDNGSFFSFRHFPQIRLTAAVRVPAGEACRRLFRLREKKNGLRIKHVREFHSSSSAS